MIDGDMQLVINTPSGKGARTDEGRIRAAAVAARHPLHHHASKPPKPPCVAMEALRDEEMTVQALQDRFPNAAKAV